MAILSITTATIPRKPQILLSHTIHFPSSLSFTSETHRTLRPAAASSGPPPPRRQPDPPPQKRLLPVEGLTGTLSKIQDGTQIFFSVFFWLSLFFWASAWDGRNKNGSDKGSRNRR